ncbi:hypothetical protein [uncultured Nostoc sp.]|uniref:hypothetical protein n=1 Tax=uncultured Nostoc sp. TaxID=340711 RepID=UPI0035CB45C8
MSLQTDEPNTVEDTRKEVTPIKSDGSPSLNLYDDPIALLMTDKLYKLLVVICMIQSNNAIVFFRHRIGRRIMRAWIFIFLFLVLISVGFGSAAFQAEHNIDLMLVLYALSMGILAIYHYNVGKELTEIKDPNQMLHTMARGDSYLMYLMDMMPRITIPMWHFYYRRWRPVLIFPLDEPTVQRVLEPIILAILGGIFALNGSALGGWLLISALCLVFVESDYHTGATNKMLDMFDSKIEARVMQAVNDSYKKQEPVRTKINGIATTSEQMLQILKQKTEKAEESY